MYRVSERTLQIVSDDVQVKITAFISIYIIKNGCLSEEDSSFISYFCDVKL